LLTFELQNTIASGMTFLPLIERELRVRSRQRAFYWWRFGVGVVGALFMLPALLSPIEPRSTVSVGAYAFNSFVVLLFILCSCAGVLTAGAVIREREEGTLGFLFLTRVNSFDIVIGALGSAGVTCLCVLLAYLPVVTLPILAGGVSAEEALRKFILLVTTLCFGLTLGLWTSARGHRRTNYTWLPAIAALLMILVTAPIGPAAALWLSGDAEYAKAPQWFWLAIVVTWVITAIGLRVAIVSLRRSITRPNEQPRDSKPINFVPAPRVPDGENPIAWITRRQRYLKIAFWTGALLSAAWISGFRFLFVFMSAFSSGFGGAYVYSSGLSTAISAIKSSLFAWAASRFIFESRRSGALELIRTTPIGAQGILPAHWAAMKRLVKWPIIVLALPLVLWLCLSFFSPFGGPPGWRGYMIYQLGYGVLGPIEIALSSIALLWCGMRFGLTARTQAAAVLYSVVLVQGAQFVIPQLWHAIVGRATVVQVWVGGSIRSSAPGTAYWIMQLMPHVILIGFFIWLYRWARRSANTVAATGK
jgi:hypothetical protein